MRPKPGPRRTKQVSLDAALIDEAERAFKRDGRTMREVTEWGLREYLAHHHPKALAKLGVDLIHRS